MVNSIVIETIDSSYTKPSEFQPCTPLGKQLLALRQQHIANGGKLLTANELEVEIEQRRGGVSDG